MTACTDVYVRPQTCDLISIFPSQVHPFVPPVDGGGGGVHPGLRPYIHPEYRPEKKKKHYDTDEDILAALGLFGPNL